MGQTIRHRLRQERFESPTHEAILNLLLAAAQVRESFDRICAEHGITPGQYNVLRILRGVHPEGYPRCEIADRLIERAPDVTRLIDRLEAAGLAERERSGHDRRLSMTRITRKGLKLLEDMRPAMDEAYRAFTSRLSPRDAKELSRICEHLYAGNQ
jgi:DNA-binding MarR family transcriptional regulator